MNDTAVLWSPMSQARMTGLRAEERGEQRGRAATCNRECIYQHGGRLSDCCALPPYPSSLPFAVEPQTSPTPRP